MPLLSEINCEGIGVGDILRLPENYDLGPGSGPVDLMVFSHEGCDLGLMVVSGYKAGLVLAVLPADARDAAGRLDAGWLMANWTSWFVFTYSGRAVPIEGAAVLRWNQRSLPEETNADSRPA